MYIVAHSMGTLFAIQASFDFPNFIKKLFLLASPMKIFMKPSMVVISAKVIFEKINVNDKIAVAAKKAYSIKPDKHVFRYVKWLPRYLELFKESKRIRPLVQNIKIPYTVFQSQKDELVSSKSFNYFKNIPNITLYILKNSRHNYYDSKDYDFC